MVNAHGLSRHIPEDVKRQVRQRCAFGCAICGATIIEYEHFLPNFVEAKFHDPDGIVLLCPSHHSKVTKGIISKVQIAAASKNPVAAQNGFSSESLPVFEGIPSIRFGQGAIMHNVLVPLMIHGEAVISLLPPELNSRVARISARLTDKQGNDFLTIENNEWVVHNGAWDFQVISNTYQFKNETGETFLKLRISAPIIIEVEELSTFIQGVKVTVSNGIMMIDELILQNSVMDTGIIGINWS